MDLAVASGSDRFYRQQQQAQHAARGGMSKVMSWSLRDV
jgi:hypothetical protein